MNEKTIRALPKKSPTHPKQFQLLLELHQSESLERKEKYWKWQEMLLDQKLKRP